MKVVILGLSITSAWGNGHAVTFRALTKALKARGHDVLFLERDTPWYRPFRDPLGPEHGRVEHYADFADLADRFGAEVRAADCVVQGSYVPEGAEVARWLARAGGGGACLFYDLDTPVTLAKLEADDREYLSREALPTFSHYLSFAGGAVLDKLAKRFGVKNPVPFWCTVDPAVHYPVSAAPRWDLGYLGTYSADRQEKLERLLCGAARVRRRGRFAVAGPMYPAEVFWPANVDRLEHVSPEEHRDFYAGQRFTLNLTRDAMTANGYAPSTRLFEAAACGTAIISDRWQGIDEFLAPGTEVLVADSTEDVLDLLHDLGDADRRQLGERARVRVLAAHTAEQRVALLERLLGCTPADPPAPSHPQPSPLA